MRLYVVRHGQSRANVDASCRVIDCELTDIGRMQAESIASDLAARGLDQIFASPYIRTLETAREIARATGAEASVLHDIHEHHLQSFPPDNWPLMTRQIMAASYPEFTIPESMAELGWHQPPESLDSIAIRMSQVLSRFRAESLVTPYARVALVTHATPIQYLVRAARQVAPTVSDVVLPVIDNASLTILEVTLDAVTIESVNGTAHLRAPVSV